MLRPSTVCVISSMRSASVDLPWSICATMQKLRMCEMSVGTRPQWYGLGLPALGSGPEALVDSPTRMANIKSQKKRNLQNEKRHQRNVAAKSSLKTSTKRVQTAVASGDADAAVTSQREAAKALDKAASKGVLHKKTAARKKSRLAKATNAVSASA